MTPAVNRPLRVLQALSDPLRFELVRELMAGPATVSELVAATASAQSNVSNHLRILRDAELVATQRNGRHIAYELADHWIAALVEHLELLDDDRNGASPNGLARARLCYDHLAGRLGVRLFDALVCERALQAPVVKTTPTSEHVRKVRGVLGDVALGTRAAAVFSSLDVDLATLRASKRRFAQVCLDWTEDSPHLGGALGAAVTTEMLRRRWLLRRSGTRALHVTPLGRDELHRRLHVDV